MSTARRICPLCEACCGLALELEGERVTAVRGDVSDVFSRGFICPKGAALGELHADPDRARARHDEHLLGLDARSDAQAALGRPHVRPLADRPGPRHRAQRAPRHHRRQPDGLEREHVDRPGLPRQEGWPFIPTLLSVFDDGDAALAIGAARIAWNKAVRKPWLEIAKCLPTTAEGLAFLTEYDAPKKQPATRAKPKR